MVRYEIIIYGSAENESFIAEVPELPGCMSDGPTYQEALKNVEIVIGEWIETAREPGRTIPEPKGTLLAARAAKEIGADFVKTCCTSDPESFHAEAATALQAGARSPDVLSLPGANPERNRRPS